MPNDPRFDQQEALKTCRFPEAWDVVGNAAPPVSIAVVDTGVYLAHRDLPDIAFESFHLPFRDDAGHGTHVAGIIGAMTDNATDIAGAVRCQLSVYRVYDIVGELDVTAYLAALERIQSSPAKVVNLSLAGLATIPRERELIDACVATGKTVVAAMGNSPPLSQGSIAFPAAHPPVIAVGSIDSAGHRESYSIGGNHIWISAPGTKVWATSALGGSVQVTGTSYSAPLVAAACALMYQRWPSITPGDITENLKRLVTRRDELRGWNAETGFGCLDIGRIDELS